LILIGAYFWCSAEISYIERLRIWWHLHILEIRLRVEGVYHVLAGHWDVRGRHRKTWEEADRRTLKLVQLLSWQENSMRKGGLEHRDSS
jgi:hypothetical protein